MYIDRMVLLIIANLVNWGIAGYGVYRRSPDFASHLLLIFMANLLLYMIFYIIMKVNVAILKSSGSPQEKCGYKCLHNLHDIFVANAPGAITLPAISLHLAVSRPVVLFALCLHSPLNFLAADTGRITHIQSGMLNITILWYSWHMALFVCCQYVLLFHGNTNLILGSNRHLVSITDVMFPWFYVSDTVNSGRWFNTYSTHEDTRILRLAFLFLWLQYARQEIGYAYE